MSLVMSLPENLRASLIHEAYAQSRGGIVITALAVAGVFGVHWLNTGEVLAPAWLLAMLSLIALRGGVVLDFLRNGRRRPLATRETLFTVPLLATSMLWAVLAPLVFPSADAAEQLALVCIFAGMAGGAATVLAPVKWCARIYIFCMLVPASVMIYRTPVTGPVLCYLGLFFTLVMLAAHHQARRLLVTSQARLLENQNLLEEVHRRRGELAHLNEQLIDAQNDLLAHNSELEQQVSERTERMRLALAAIENTAEGVIVASADGTIVQVNPAFSRITGHPADSAFGRPLTMLRSDRQDGAFYRRMEQQLDDCGRWEGELWSRRKDGSEFLERRTVDAVRDADGRTTHFVTVFNDTTGDYHLDQQLRHQAMHDPLTGLGNRSLLSERLESGIDQAARDGTRLGLLFFDLDQFKAVNDNLGHHTGDALLQAVAGRLAHCLKASDTLVRVGGDEFVVVATRVNGAEDCARLARRLLDSFTEPFVFPETRIHMRSSLGISIYPDDARNAEDLLKNADMALYAAKGAGRNTYAFFDSRLATQARERLDMEVALREALDAGEMTLHYQAKVAASDRRVVGFEALLRWHSSDLGAVPPDRFIPVAEDAGLIGSLGAWVLAESCRQIAAWHRLGYGWQRVAINVSARQLFTDDLPLLVETLTAEHGISPRLLEVEVTETFVMNNPDQPMPILERLRALGVRIAIDDFGTGHSSLAYLRRLPADQLKIDRSFVAEVDNDATIRSIIGTIISLSRTLGLSVVAEGIETETQARLLTEAGCDVLQGHLFAMPLPAEQIEPQAIVETTGED